MKKSSVLVCLVVLIQGGAVLAGSCPDLSGSYSCTGTPPSHSSNFTQTVYQTVDSITFGDGATPIKLNGLTTVDRPQGHVEVTTVCSSTDVTMSFTLNGQPIPRKSVVTKTPSGYSSVDADGSTANCTLVKK